MSVFILRGYPDNPPKARATILSLAEDDMSVRIDQLSEPGEYDDEMLTLLQIIWGDGFLSPGGGEEIMRLLEGSDITGCHVLDIGCGLGAIDEFLVTHFGAGSVLGIDIDPRLVSGMQRRIKN